MLKKGEARCAGPTPPLPDLDLEFVNARILKRSDGRIRTVSHLTEIVGINGQGQAIGILERQTRNLGLPQQVGGYELGCCFLRRLIQC